MVNIRNRFVPTKSDQEMTDHAVAECLISDNSVIRPALRRAERSRPVPLSWELKPTASDGAQVNWALGGGQASSLAHQRCKDIFASIKLLFYSLCSVVFLRGDVIAVHQDSE
ncbi:hypothetical protein AAG570_002822 [Ranatra chinensis]|uniref:Uncharacterized protein n=1 Tax=Ranatra chinensis TaxID=642074 RepID=A0ABD0Y4Y4_9HEMI